MPIKMKKSKIMNKMKNFFLTLVAVAISMVVAAQPMMMQPVAWSSSVEQLGDGQYRIDFKASIDEGWHLYDPP